MSPSPYYVLAASLRSKNSSATIVSQEDPAKSSPKGSLHRMNRLARLKQLCRITGAASRLLSGRTLGQPGKASATAMDSEQPFPFLFPDPESMQHSPYHPSPPAVEPLSCVEQFAVKVEPYFVRSTASASEICPAIPAVLPLFLLCQIRACLTSFTHLRVAEVPTLTWN